MFGKSLNTGSFEIFSRKTLFVHSLNRKAFVDQVLQEFSLNWIDSSSLLQMLSNQIINHHKKCFIQAKKLLTLISGELGDVDSFYPPETTHRTIPTEQWRSFLWKLLLAKESFVWRNFFFPNASIDMRAQSYNLSSFFPSSEKNILIWMKMMEESSAKVHTLICDEELGEFSLCEFEWGWKIYRSFYHVFAAMPGMLNVKSLSERHSLSSITIWIEKKSSTKLFPFPATHTAAHSKDGKGERLRSITLNSQTKWPSP